MLTNDLYRQLSGAGKPSYSYMLGNIIGNFIVLVSKCTVATVTVIEVARIMGAIK